MNREYGSWQKRAEGAAPFRISGLECGTEVIATSAFVFL